jgi:hypothetical protein
VWLRRYATGRKIAGSKIDEMNDFFNLPIPSGRTQPNKNEYQKQKKHVSGE